MVPYGQNGVRYRSNYISRGLYDRLVNITDRSAELHDSQSREAVKYGHEYRGTRTHQGVLLARASRNLQYSHRATYQIVRTLGGGGDWKDRWISWDRGA
jgi:hypothetical protein